jgi:DNA-binding response OmpR family regulator
MILVVEDNKAFRIMIKKTLERAGYRVITAKNGKEGLNSLENQIPDLIISDIIMPEMDGFTFLEEVRKTYPLIPFTLLSIKSDLKDYSKGYNLGATDYITKPFEMKTLIKKVQKRLNSYKSIQAVIDKKIDTINLANVSLIDFFHTIQVKKFDCTITIFSKEGNGTFIIKNGKVKSSDFSNLKGMKAISKATSLKSGKASIIRLND